MSIKKNEQSYIVHINRSDSWLHTFRTVLKEYKPNDVNISPLFDEDKEKSVYGLTGSSGSPGGFEVVSEAIDKLISMGTEQDRLLTLPTTFWFIGANLVENLFSRFDKKHWGKDGSLIYHKIMDTFRGRKLISTQNQYFITASTNPELLAYETPDTENSAQMTARFDAVFDLASFNPIVYVETLISLLEADAFNHGKGRLQNPFNFPIRVT